MTFLDRLIGQFSPATALERARARKALRVLAHYDAASGGRRSQSWRPSASDADGAGARRARLAYVSRDMIRNTPFAFRAQQVIANNVIGDGIIPKIKTTNELLRQSGLELIEAHFDTTAIDADGRNNLYGLQRLIMNTVVDSGEVLVRRRRRRPSDGLPLPFQVQVLEPEFLDDARDGPLPTGGKISEGIEYDPIGRRTAYWLFDAHPGASSWRGRDSGRSRRVDASEILHIYRQDRPGQSRGVTWFAPVAMNLQDLGDYQDAQIVRQKIAACFAAFRIAPDAEGAESDLAGTILPGAIMDLGPGEDIKFADPPGVTGYDEFTRAVLRAIASGMGITYEALTGDLSNVNFSSARIGRAEMDRNISSWQWLMIVPQFCQPLGQWFREAWEVSGNAQAGSVQIEWVPPHRFLVDPAREIPALQAKVRAGFASRQGVVRELGYDPERLLSEQIEDAAQADAAGLTFDSDARQATAGQPAVERAQDE